MLGILRAYLHASPGGGHMLMLFVAFAACSSPDLGMCALYFRSPSFPRWRRRPRHRKVDGSLPKRTDPVLRSAHTLGKGGGGGDVLHKQCSQTMLSAAPPLDRRPEQTPKLLNEYSKRHVRGHFVRRHPSFDQHEVDVGRFGPKFGQHHRFRDVDQHWPISIFALQNRVFGVFFE